MEAPADRACKQWACLQCNHFAALLVLTRSLGVLHISLVDHQHPKLSNLEMENWEITLTDLAKGAWRISGPQPPTSASFSEVLETNKYASSLFDAQTVICCLKTNRV